ncbi:hypothetical protein TKK_0000062 [Trichogramma kaykai]|uniref:BTB domain-containing protein n=1 Tax=Trichogramma kaykai TaxID=54128 RepID=A0ABD2VUR1_9HYME
MDHQNEEHTDTDTNTEEEGEEELFQVTKAPLTCASVAPVMLEQSWESILEPKLEELVTFEWTVYNFQLVQGRRRSPNFYAFGRPFNFELQFITDDECCPGLHLTVLLYSDDVELLKPSDFEIYVRNSKMDYPLMLYSDEFCENFEHWVESFCLFVGFVHYDRVKDCNRISVVFRAKQDILKERVTGAATSKDEKREMDDANELELAWKDSSKQHNMEPLWSSHEYLSDLAIQCDGERFHVHKCVLAAASRSFRAFFWLASRTRTRCDHLVYDEDIGGRDLQAYLRFLYTGELPTTTGADLARAASTQLRLATRFDTPRLEERCRGYLQACVNRAADSIAAEKWYGYCWMTLSDLRYGIDDHPSLL